MEASVVNLLSPGDTAIVILGGKFAERWQGLCRAYGMNTVSIPVEYGDAVDPQQVKKALSENPDAKVVFGTLCETSTGIVNDIKSIASIVQKTDAVLVVDAISGLLADDCKTDEWGVDVVVTGSQKGLMLPPGLAFISLSDKAWKLVDQAKSPRFYTDLRMYKKSIADDDTPFTSAVSIVIALDEAVKLILQMGVENMISRCALMADATRQGAKALGLSIFSKRPSNGVTAINSPSGIDGKQITKLMYDQSKVMVAGGQGDMAGKIFRFAHMGFISPEDVICGFEALEKTLASLNYSFKPGDGIKAAKQVFAKSCSAVSV
jgi:aspartate aminotransferase-like enzyme